VQKKHLVIDADPREKDGYETRTISHWSLTDEWKLSKHHREQAKTPREKEETTDKHRALDKQAN